MWLMQKTWRCHSRRSATMELSIRSRSDRRQAWSSMSDAARWAATARAVEPDPARAATTQDGYGRVLELANPIRRGHN